MGHNILNNNEKVSVLFICMGNICRSPTAEGVFRKMVNSSSMQNSIAIDSAGTHAYHIGQPPDERAMRSAFQRGYDLSNQRARRVTTEDFGQFHYVLAMDRSNYHDLLQMSPPEHQDRISLFLDYHPDPAYIDVPDPYYGGGSGFEEVLDLVETASDHLLQKVIKDLR